MLAAYSSPRWLSVVRGAVDETLTNIARHCYGNRLDQRIALYFRSAKRCQHGEIESGLEILLCAHGRAIDRNTLRGRPLEPIRPGGLGLHLIRQAMNTVEFTRNGLTNQLRLAKYFAQASDAP